MLNPPLLLVMLEDRLSGRFYIIHVMSQIDIFPEGTSVDVDYIKFKDSPKSRLSVLWFQSFVKLQMLLVGVGKQSASLEQLIRVLDCTVSQEFH